MIFVAGWYAWRVAGARELPRLPPTSMTVGRCHSERVPHSIILSSQALMVVDCDCWCTAGAGPLGGRERRERERDPSPGPLQLLRAATSSSGAWEEEEEI